MKRFIVAMIESLPFIIFLLLLIFFIVGIFIRSYCNTIDTSSNSIEKIRLDKGQAVEVITDGGRKYYITNEGILVPNDKDELREYAIYKSYYLFKED